MLAALRKRHDRDDEGFTLIELMVVVLIIAILLAIAIPTFLGARNRANDRSAQSSLRNALTAAKTIYTDTQNYASADVAALQDVEQSLTFVASTTDSTKAKEVSINASSADTWAAAAWSKSKKCFYIKDIGAAATTGVSNTAAAGTYFGKDTSSNASTNCDGAAALTSATSKDSDVGW